MADDPSARAGTNDARFTLEHSHAALKDVIRSFEILSQRMKDGDDSVTLAEIQRARGAMGQVRSQLVDEVIKHEKRVFRSEGLASDAALDLDELRASIGRKLDRIRDAENPGGVSGEA